MDREELKAWATNHAERKVSGSRTELAVAKAVLSILSEHEAYKKVVDAAKEWANSENLFSRSVRESEEATKLFNTVSELIEEDK